ncbi:MAG: 16S rRNA (cytosine(967)-C(5))-methyltransferase RsmB [Eubacteriales bacterium]|nr:16S rRNA (cytosine(967)-C(5))-methyltransferase RsmB [Eubacteriales bacterium]
MTNSVNLRAVVLDILMEINEHHGFSHLVLNQALLKYQYLDKSQRGFITRVAQGTVEKKIQLDYCINQFSKTPVNKCKPVIRCILEMAVYQLLYMENIPQSAVCNEAVKLAVKRGFSPLRGFVNGVLRNIARGLDDIKYPDEKKEPYRYLSVKYSMPEWILDLWKKTYDFETIVDILEGFSQDKKTYIRCNTSLKTPEEIRKVLEAEGVYVKGAAGLSYAYEIGGYDYLADLDSFKEGLYQIQDISSMKAGEIANPGFSDYVIDVCAAPGGKSVQAALKMYENAAASGKAVTGKVDSRDVSDYKLGLIEQNIERLGISNIDTKVWDATVLDEKCVGRADIVIADLPCSGLGIIGRKPDIKYQASIEKLEELVNLQRKILGTVYKYVKKGGYLVYSTCTINKAENEDNADWICEELGFEKCGNYIQMLPSKEEYDGFFVAKLRKK